MAKKEKAGKEQKRQKEELNLEDLKDVNGMGLKDAPRVPTHDIDDDLKNKI